jgi:hypothetical protein
MIKRPVMKSDRSFLASTMLACAVMAILAVVPARADDAVTLSLEIKDHRFDPAGSPGDRLPSAGQHPHGV